MVGEVRLRQAHDGSWIVEIHYRGSAIRDVVGMRVHQGEALALAAFTKLVLADDQLSTLDRESDRIAADHLREQWSTEEGSS